MFANPMNTKPTTSVPHLFRWVICRIGLDELDGMQDEEVIVHCRSGKRSGMAQKILEENGFNNVRNVIGGMLAYRAQ